MAGRELRRAALTVGVLVLHAVVAAPNDEPPPREGDRVDWHVVQPGDTLQSLARRHLGDAALYTENVRLNPGVDPTRLRIGSRVRIVLARNPPARSARVVEVSRRVEAQFHPQPPWLPAKRGDGLKEKDGVRTHERSSAELAFDDGSSLVLTEQSLVFLRQVGSTLRGVPRESIEILEGQVDLTQRPKRASPQIEIVVAGALARPRPGAGGSAATRARRDADAAAVMSFGGSSEVESGGQTVQVPQGMGTTVPAGRPPRAPERLLAAPRASGPVRFAFANPALHWRAVTGAASYTAEVFADEACTRLAARGSGLTTTGWRVEGLASGSYFWRVTAVSASGLDGYPSRPRPLELASDRVDRDPPVVVVAIEGAGRAESSQRIRLGPRSALRLVAQDDASGVESVRCRWDSGSWMSATAPLQPPSSGEHRLEFQATDAAERESQVWSVTILGTLGPAPPSVIPEPPDHP